MKAIETMMPQPRSSHTLRPRQPTRRHAGRFSRCSGSNCFAWLLLAGCILVVSTGTSAMPATAVEGHETTLVDLGAMLDAGDGAVLTLVAGNTRLAVHRAVLAARSQVFAAMLGYDPLEVRRQEFVISDVEGPDLRKLVAFMYSGTAPQHRGMTPQLLDAAKKYGVSGLRDAFEQQLARHLTVDNAAAKAVLAVTDDYPTLRQAAVDFIRDNAFQVMATQGWAEAVQNHPGAVVEFTRLLVEATTETSAPATVRSEATPTTQSNSDDGRTSDAATTSTARRLTATLDNAAVSHFCSTAAEGSEATRTAPPHSDHGRTPAADTTPSPLPDTPPLDGAAVSRLRSLSGEEKDRRLRQAALEGAVGEVRALLAAGADVAARDENEDTALHWAAYWGHVEVVRALLAVGADIGARDKFNLTALHEAARRGHVEVTRCLLQAGAEVDARDKWQMTPLHLATESESDNTAVVRLLLAASANPDTKNQEGWTPLHFVAFTGQPQAATALLEAGADRGARDDRGRTPLDVAREFNRQQLILMLERY